jgi:putative ABC transport system permease protein
MTVKHHALLLFRRLRRFKTQYLISFSGLFLATATFLLLLHFISYHYSFDRFHRQADDIVRLNTHINLPDQQNKYAATAFGIGPEMAELYPEIQEAVRIRVMPGTVEYDNQRFEEGMLTFVDEAFLEVFSFPVIDGNPATCLEAPNSLVIRKEIAEKYFPGESPVGKSVQVTIGNEQVAMTISAVVDEPPPNSSINFQMLVNIERIAANARPGYASLIPGLYTYFQLQPHTPKSVLDTHLDNFVQDKLPENLQSVMAFYAMPMKDIYFEQDYQFDAGQKGNRSTLTSLLVLAFITLLMAVINYVNITTTQGMKRSREIAVRKILGSSVARIASGQYLDSLVIIALTLLPAAILSKALLPKIDTWLELELTAGPLNNWAFWLLLLPFAALLAFFAAIYPALMLSQLSITEVLKRNAKFAVLRFDLKKILIGFQFAVAVFFLSAAWIVYSQLQFLRDKHPGFDKDQVVLVDVAGPQLQSRIPGIKQQLKQVPGVEQISVSTTGIYGAHTQANFSVPSDSTSDAFLFDMNYVDPDFLETYGVKLLAGRDFSNEIDQAPAFIINEAAAKRLGLTDYESALGLQLQKTTRDTIQAQLIGFVADYHFQSMYQSISPMVWQVMDEQPKNVLAVRIGGDVQNVIKSLEEQWTRLNTGETLTFSFLDDNMEYAYRTEQQMGLFVRIISAVLLFITCSGLYGMMLFLIEQKTMEIGIRKTFGAGSLDIQAHLYRQYLWLTLAGIFLGGGVAYWLSNRWLENFAYHIEFQPAWLLLAGSLCLLLGWLSISFLGFRAGRINPVEAMKEV